MKKLLIIALILISALISGCNNNTTTKPSEESKIIKDLAPNTKLVNTVINRYGDHLFITTRPMRDDEKAEEYEVVEYYRNAPSHEGKSTFIIREYKNK